MPALRVIVAAGGTGGHLHPAMSLARAIKALKPEAEFLFVGAGRPLEAALLEPAGFRHVALKSSGLKGRGLGGQLQALWQCLLATREALGLIRDFSPQLCFGAGGYVTVPVGLAARLSGTPLVIHEQNSRPGLSNRVLGRLAGLVLLGFEEASGSFPAAKTRFTGNPVRPEIAALHRLERDYGHKPLTIGITGGSQGAAGLNKAVAPALVNLYQSGQSIRVIHQTGETDFEWVRDFYQKIGLPADVSPFIQDMVDFYSQADLVISRAGALTSAELAAARRPAILVPLPTAADDHQTVNARQLETAGAALLQPQEAMSPESLATVIKDLLVDRERLKAMSEAAGRLACLGADEEMAKACLEFLDRLAADDGSTHEDN